jgi:hypothetical protein
VPHRVHHEVRESRQALSKALEPTLAHERAATREKHVRRQVIPTLRVARISNDCAPVMTAQEVRGHLVTDAKIRAIFVNSPLRLRQAETRCRSIVLGRVALTIASEIRTERTLGLHFQLSDLRRKQPPSLDPLYPDMRGNVWVGRLVAEAP